MFSQKLSMHRDEPRELPTRLFGFSIVTPKTKCFLHVFTQKSKNGKVLLASRSIEISKHSIEAERLSIFLVVILRIKYLRSFLCALSNRNETNGEPIPAKPLRKSIAAQRARVLVNVYVQSCAHRIFTYAWTCRRQRGINSSRTHAHLCGRQAPPCRFCVRLCVDERT